jgi:hypothetical protein
VALVQLENRQYTQKKVLVQAERMFVQAEGKKQNLF